MNNTSGSRQISSPPINRQRDNQQGRLWRGAGFGCDGGRGCPRPVCYGFQEDGAQCQKDDGGEIASPLLRSVSQ